MQNLLSSEKRTLDHWVLFLHSPGKTLLTLSLVQKWLGSSFPEDVWAWWLLMHWLQLQSTPCEALTSVWIGFAWLYSQACSHPALTDTVTSYISFCEDMCVPTRTYLTFNNDKPWFSTKLKQLHLAKEDAYRSGEKALYKQAKYTLNREIRVAKKNYAGKLKKQLSSNDPTSVWKGLKAITSYKTPPPSTEANQQLTEDLNSFYCRFQKQKPGLTPHTHSDHPTTQPSTLSPSPSPYCFSACNQDLWRRCKQSLQETEDKESQRPRRCLSSLPQSLCCSAIIHLHIDLQ